MITSRKRLHWESSRYPEGFEYDGSEEKTEEAFKYTMEQQEEKARGQLFEKISDPYLQELVDYGMKAGEFANIKEFGTNLKEHLDASKIDETDVTQATEIARKHLLDIGNSPRIVDRVIKEATDNDELTELGLDGKNYFIKKAEEAITTAKINDAAAARDLKKAQQEYQDQFMSTLKTAKLKAEDRQSILSSFDNVELQNGNKMPEYEYKLEQIKRNPNDFIEFLQILGKYETGKGFNLGTSTEAATNKIKSIFETLNGKKPTIVKSGNINTSDKTKFIPKFKDTSTHI